MGRSKSNLFDGWTSGEIEFVLKQYEYYKTRWDYDFSSVKRAYWEKYHELNTKYGLRDKCPTSDLIRAWVEFAETQGTSKQTEEQKPTETSKLSGPKWGRKPGENRSIRKESVDMEEQHPAIKWKQGDTKWSGPRAVERRRIDVPVIGGATIKYPPYWWSPPSSPPNKEKVKLEKKQVLKEKFEEEVLELVDRLDAHKHATPASAFVSLHAALQRHAVDGVLAKHRATLADHVARALRRGKDGERKAAAAIAPLLALQIGEEGMEQFVREVRPGLIATASDKTASIDTRTECCSSLAVLCYLMDEDITETLEVMHTFETIFSGSYVKNDRSVKASGAAVEEGAWHAAALDGWALLFSMLSPNHALSLLNHQAPSFTRLGELLEAASLEVRMAAGGALAIAYETVSDDDNSGNALTPQVDALLPRLTELARDSDKIRAKKDRKIQRATFREILKYFEDGEAPCTSAHIGTETAEWSSWSGGAAYAALAGALGGALQVLAPHCPSLRAALQLSTEVPVEEKPNKLQRHRQNKAKSKSRNKNKDKRIHQLSSQ
ncbi:hypothetical protein PYW07_015632 [Mythimna separata]|uniref:Interferon-related developmental regulator N-terminal domain-containing protein n=1 Tax=Mythimna separata TaxID=271217 RepID=A0AAD7Z1B8_MYTSE|nr:hypothetical protein PYW07_015632 [Mythimna separata]